MIAYDFTSFCSLNSHSQAYYKLIRYLFFYLLLGLMLMACSKQEHSPTPNLISLRRTFEIWELAIQVEGEKSQLLDAISASLVTDVLTLRALGFEIEPALPGEQLVVLCKLSRPPGSKAIDYYENATIRTAVSEYIQTLLPDVMERITFLQKAGRGSGCNIVAE